VCLQGSEIQTEEVQKGEECEKGTAYT